MTVAVAQQGGQGRLEEALACFLEAYQARPSWSPSSAAGAR